MARVVPDTQGNSGSYQARTGSAWFCSSTAAWTAERKIGGKERKSGNSLSGSRKQRFPHWIKIMWRLTPICMRAGWKRLVRGNYSKETSLAGYEQIEFYTALENYDPLSTSVISSPNLKSRWLELGIKPNARSTCNKSITIHDLIVNKRIDIGIYY